MMMLAQRFVRASPKLLHAPVAALPLQRLAAPLVSGRVGCLPSARGVCNLGPLLSGGGFSTPPAIVTVRSGTVGGGGAGGSVVTLPQQGYRSASGTSRLKAKLKAKHRRAKGGANPRGKSQLPKGKRRSRKKPLPGRR